MTLSHRLALILSAVTLAAGLAGVPATYAMDSMKGGMMQHKHMKKHKAMKGGHMKGGDAMQGGDAMKPAETPAQ